MISESTKLARLWIDLSEIKTKLDNEIIPVSGYLGMDDSGLMIAMEELSDEIGKHFNNFRLVAEAKKEAIKND